MREIVNLEIGSPSLPAGAIMITHDIGKKLRGHGSGHDPVQVRARGTPGQRRVASMPAVLETVVVRDERQAMMRR